MTVLYEAYQSSLKNNKSGKYLFYPRVVKISNVETDTLAQEISQFASLSPGDVKSTLDGLVTVMTRHLQNSESVTLNGLGSFRYVMKSRNGGRETAKEVNASQATLYVRFTPAYTKNPDGTRATRSLLTGAKCKRYNRLTGITSDIEELPDLEQKPGTNPDGGNSDGNLGDI